MLNITPFLCIATSIVTITTAQELRTTCPPGGFTENVESSVSCLVDKPFYDACIPSPTIVTFLFLPDTGGNKIPWCSTSYAACESTGNPEPICNGCSCKCASNTSSVFTYNLTFVPALNYHNGSFFCDVTCIVPTPTENHTSCERITVATPPTSDGLKDSEKAVIAVGVVFGLSGLLTLVLFLVRIKGVVYVGHDDEQIKRIDYYVQLLRENKDALQNIERKGGFCCCDTPTKLAVDGFHALGKDGRPKDVQEQLHIKISIRLFFVCCRSMKTIKEEVQDFLSKNVTRFEVRIVKGGLDVDRQKLESIATRTGTNILPPAENRKGQTVIQIEGHEGVDAAKMEVEKLI